MTTSESINFDGHGEVEVGLLYPEVGPLRSVWRERTMRFRSYMDMRENLRREYPDRWVAVVRGDLIIVADDVDVLRQKVADSGYDPAASVIKYLFTGRSLQDNLRDAARTYARGNRTV